MTHAWPLLRWALGIALYSLVMGDPHAWPFKRSWKVGAQVSRLREHQNQAIGIVWQGTTCATDNFTYLLKRPIGWQQ
jgi:hypothetical protein